MADKQELVMAEIAQHAESLKIADPDAVYEMLQERGELRYDAWSEKPKNVEKLLKALLAENPRLKRDATKEELLAAAQRDAEFAKEQYKAHRKGFGLARPDLWKQAESSSQDQRNTTATTDPKEAYARHRQGGGLGNPNLWKH